MNKRNGMNVTSRHIVKGVVILAGVVCISTLVQALWYVPDSELPVPLAAPYMLATSSPPMRLRIPSLNLDANVQNVGISKSGAMSVPNNYTDVGWYRYGTVPGSLGSAVIDGHVDNGFAMPGVFKHLGDIKKGADVYIVTKDGSNIHYVVTDIRIYPYKDAPTNMIFDRRDTARLNLITCEGYWVAKDMTYAKRLVVFTELKGAEATFR